MHKNKHKVYLVSLGCSRNLVDSEIILGSLKNHGLDITGRPDNADYLIVNTCAFIEDSKKESIDKILEVAAYKKHGKKLIVTGCLPQRYPGELIKQMPEIDAIFGASDVLELRRYIDGSSRVKNSVSSDLTFLYDSDKAREMITPAHFAYVKIQEGCVNRCSYCVIPDIRGKYRSRDIEDVLCEVDRLVNSVKVSEINIIGQDTTLYGIDKYGSKRLPELLSKSAEIMKNGWIRLLYTHPAHISEDLIQVIKNEPSICKYIDMPVQHINDRILKLMNRQVSRREIETLIKKIRKEMPGAALRTSVIVGFPGETNKEFKELLAFVKDAGFERLGAFAYSKEEGTPAYNFKGQVNAQEKLSRRDIIMTAQREIARKANKKFMGKQLRVLVEGLYDKGECQYSGRSEYDAPDIDGMCIVRSKRTLKNGEFVNAVITDALEYDLIGDVDACALPASDHHSKKSSAERHNARNA